MLVIFRQKNIGKNSACKMLVKLIPEVTIFKSSSSLLEQKQNLIDSNKNSTIKGFSTLKVSKDPIKARGVLSDPAFVPAWIFSTRYSDRPASGKLNTVKIECNELSHITNFQL